MSVLLIGSNGSMGKRYSAIFKSMGVPFYGMDKEHSNKEIFAAARAKYTNAILIATPTDMHRDFLYEFADIKKPVLCEKPVIKRSMELSRILDIYEKHKTPFNMVMQYSELIDDDSSGETNYDYFRTGNDGLYWDCLQIIALAESEFKLNNQSPIWNCTINGKILSLSNMDRAYVKFIDRWLNGELKQSHKYLINTHKKVEDYINELSRNKSIDRNSGQVYQ